MPERTIGIALLGCGVVGGGVTNILLNQRHLLRQRTGLDLVLRHVVVKSEADYPPNHDELPMSLDAEAAIDDPDVDVVIELIGGTNVACNFVQRALQRGKPVITANKALLAVKGPELFALAREHDTCIAFEASAGGGIPIIDPLQRGLLANRVDALLGIVNGTCNFILSQMTQKGETYEQALREAQAQGFAEANPTMDVSGRDSAQKLAILASLAFNVRVEEKDVYLEGIEKLDATDIAFARELGYVIKLLAIAERIFPSPATSNQKPSTSNHQLATSNSTQLALRVHPTLVHEDDLLAQVSGSFNAISFYGHALGHALFYGRGAGRMPTASAVVSDLIGVALGTTPAQFKSLRIFADQTPPVNVQPFAQLRSRYYLRLMAKDQPGVLAQVTKVLGDQQISIASFVQHESHTSDSVPLVLTTHLAREGAIQQALKQIESLPPITAPAVCIRIIDQPTEFAG